MDNNMLIKKCKLLKAEQDISYKELSEYINITQNSFYNWINGQYKLSNEKLSLLDDIINTLTD